MQMEQCPFEKAKHFVFFLAVQRAFKRVAWTTVKRTA